MQLAWQTASELDNAGFNLWRTELPAGPRILVNESLIPAQGGPLQGAAYAYDDVDAVPGPIYRYELEAVDVYGQSTFYGPVRAGLPLLGLGQPGGFEVASEPDSGGE